MSTFHNIDCGPKRQRLKKNRQRAAELRRLGRLQQAAKIKQLQRVLFDLGYKTIRQQASVLGLNKSTAWAIFNSEHTRNGLSGATVKQLLSAPTPPGLRQVIQEYVTERLAGKYGHTASQLNPWRVRAGFDLKQVQRGGRRHRIGNGLHRQPLDSSKHSGATLIFDSLRLDERVFLSKILASLDGRTVGATMGRVAPEHGKLAQLPGARPPTSKPNGQQGVLLP